MSWGGKVKKKKNNVYSEWSEWIVFTRSQIVNLRH